MVFPAHPVDRVVGRQAVQDSQGGKRGAGPPAAPAARNLDLLSVPGPPQRLLQTVQSINLIRRNPEVRPPDPAMRPGWQWPVGEGQQEVGG
jgi:hypothetical protein